jgi:hypothetical protein
MSRLFALAFVALITLATAHAASAQTTKTPGVDCSLLTRQQAAGLVCATPPRDEPTTDTDTPPTCDPRPNPYLEPDRAAACTAWEATHRPKPVLPTYEVDAVYKDAYDDMRIYVLAVSRSLEGVPVVTAQRVKPADGYVLSFRVDQGKPWEKLPTP